MTERITSGLRTWTSDHFGVGDWRYESIMKLADRIDSAHEHGMEERADRYSELRAKMNNCYIELPKDADGEYIHIGDVMDGVNKYDTLQEVTGVVTTISFDDTLDPNDSTSVGIRVWADDNKSSRVIYIDPYASVYRHHHAPTVEDVLQEFAQRWDDPMSYDRDELVEQYAAKLRLTDDGKEQ